MIELHNGLWAVEVPEGAKQLHIETDLDGKPYVGYKFKDDELLNEYQLIYILPGTWEIVCTSKEVSVVQAMEIVEQEGDTFKDYDKDRFHNDIPFSSPIDSLNSLLTSKGYDLNKTYLILKKQ